MKNYILKDLEMTNILGSFLSSRANILFGLGGGGGGGVCCCGILIW